jgi:RluA family pseudouridine synthase
MDSHCKHEISNIPVVYEDNWFLIVDKPSGLLTIPTPKKESRTLTSILNADLENRGLSYRLHPCHRLDRETSGLIIYAKGKSTQQKMMELFKQKKVRKSYIAFAQGDFANSHGRIRIPIKNLGAVTEYKVLKRRKDFTVVQATPLTGRTNQIRIHFKQIGHPILGETRYAFRRDFKIKAKRLCLHADRLEFIHPITKNLISLSADLPSSMIEINRD